MRVIGQVCDFSTRDVESCSNDIATHLWGLCELQKLCDLLLKSLSAIKVLRLIVKSVVSYQGIVTYSFCSNYPHIVTCSSFCCELSGHCDLSFILLWVLKILWLVIHSVVSYPDNVTYHSPRRELSRHCDLSLILFEVFRYRGLSFILLWVIKTWWFITHFVVSS